MAIAASVQPESGRIVYAGSDFSHPFQLRFFQKGIDHIVQNWPRSDLDGLVRVWPNASGLEANRCTGVIGPGFWQDATSPLPLVQFQTRLRSSANSLDHTVQNQPGSDWVLADSVSGFGQNGSGPGASRCARIIRPPSGQCFQADPDQTRHVYRDRIQHTIMIMLCVFFTAVTSPRLFNRSRRPRGPPWSAWSSLCWSEGRAWAQW